MPILLTNPFNPGDMDPGKTYPYVKLSFIGIYLTNKQISLQWQYGDEVSGVWTPGKIQAPGCMAQIIEEDYDTVIASETVSGDEGVVYDAVRRVLYSWMIDEGIVQGTLV
jgi:hypothetical protein